jgi:hypothetical protein
VFGGDPASAERSKTRREMIETLQAVEFDGNQISAEAVAATLGKSITEIQHRKLRLPLLAENLGIGPGGNYKKPEYPPIPAQIERAGCKALWLVSPSLARAREHMTQLDELFAGTSELELQLEDYSGFAEALEDGSLFGRRVTRVIVKTAADAQAMLALAAEFEVCVELSREVEPWLLELARQAQAPARLALRQPTYERLTESAERDLDLPAFFSIFTHTVPVDDVPSCVLGRSARKRRELLDTSMMTLDGKLEIFRYIKRYILDRYWRKSLRCKTCVYNQDCRGMHISYIRAHGFALMQPVEATQ